MRVPRPLVVIGSIAAGVAATLALAAWPAVTALALGSAPDAGDAEPPEPTGWRARRRARKAGRVTSDPAHAPGKKHRGAPDDGPAMHDQGGSATKNQPWLRTSHADSQSRRFRRGR